MLTIKQILDQYLQEQKKRLAPKTFGYYENMVGYFEHCCNSYYDMCLDDNDLEKYEKEYEKNMKLEFCEFFGSEVLDYCMFSELVGYFIPRKVLCGYDQAQRMCSAAVNCCKWLYCHGYIKNEDGDDIKDVERELRYSFKDGWQEFNKESCDLEID